MPRDSRRPGAAPTATKPLRPVATPHRRRRRPPETPNPAKSRKTRGFLGHWPPGVVAVTGSAYGWGAIPLLTVYDNATDLPLLPWNRSLPLLPGG